MAFREIKAHPTGPNDPKIRRAREALDQLAKAMEAVSAPVFRQAQQANLHSVALRQNRDMREGRSSERKVAAAVLKLLSEQPDGGAYIEQIRRDLPIDLAAPGDRNG